MRLVAHPQAPPADLDAQNPSNLFPTEASIAELFIAKWRMIIFRHRTEDLDENPSFYIPTLIDPRTDRVASPGFNDLPPGFLIRKINDLITSLDITDAATLARCQSWAFVRGVYAFVASDPRLVRDKMCPARDEFVYALADKVIEETYDYRQSLKSAANGR